MNKWKEMLAAALSKLRQTGFFSIFLSNVFCQVFSFLGGMVVVRVLSKGDYGVYMYVKNCYGILFVLNDLGCGVAAMQLCSEEYRNRRRMAGFYYYGLSRGLLFSLLSGLLMLASPLFYPYRHEGAAQLVQLLCLSPPLVTLNSFITISLRVQLENRRYAGINLFGTLCNYAAIIPMALAFGIRGAVLSVYVIQLINLAAGLWISGKRKMPFREREQLERPQRRKLLRLGFASQLSNGLDSMLMLLDVFLIGLFISDMEVISSYKVASTIPTALAFIPSAVMVYTVPYFARNHGDLKWLKRNCFRLFSALAGINLLIVAGGCLLAPVIISLVFGTQYADAVPCFRILLLGYWFSGTLRTPAANILYTQKKVGINLTVTVISGVCNCILDVVLILHFASVGAAWATTLVRLLAGVINVAFLYGKVLRRTPQQWAAEDRE